MHKPEPVRENEMHTVLENFEMQSENLIKARRPELIFINKKMKLLFSGFCLLGDHKVKIRESKNRQILRPSQRIKICNMWVTVISIAVSALGTALKGLRKKTGRFGNQRKNQGFISVKIC